MMTLNSLVCMSGMDSSHLLSGRPYILWYTFSEISTRLCYLVKELLFNSNGASTLLICVYMYLPTNYGTSASHDKFLYSLRELDGFIDCHQFDNLLIGGDFNVDFSQTSTHSTHLNGFMCDQSLSSADLPFISDNNIIILCFLVKRLDIGSNLSDHYPLAVSLFFDCTSSPSVPVASVASNSAQSIAWHHATKQQLALYCDAVAKLSACFLFCC